jgi:hypothetical protein
VWLLLLAAAAALRGSHAGQYLLDVHAASGVRRFAT